MDKKFIINWELLLNCNLNCSFCSQKERRIENKKTINLEKAKKIIDNLPSNSHISFLGGETFLFKGIFDLLSYIEKKKINYEITTNGTIIDKYIKDINSLKFLTKLIISIDGYGINHDISRGKVGLFNKIKNVIPKIQKDISVSTVIGYNNSYDNYIKLYLFLNKLGVKEQKLIYCMSFGEKEIQNSIKKIPDLIIKKPGINKNNYNKDEYKKLFLKTFLAIKKLGGTMKILTEPNIKIILGKQQKYLCKQLNDQLRINESGSISICEFITNKFLDVRNNKLIDIIKNDDYIKLKTQIQELFPLEICQKCCKLYKNK